MSGMSIRRYDNYFKENDCFIYMQSADRIYVLKITYMNPGSGDIEICNTHRAGMFYSNIFTKYTADIPRVYKIKQFYK
jgi:hypothetical protein|nr:MAG TPA: hypothetical protein [Caudoviricetes sp.]